MPRRARLNALAGRRSTFASRAYARFRDGLAKSLADQVREFAVRVRKKQYPFLPDSMVRRWSRELFRVQRAQLPFMAAHGWNLAGEEVAAAQGKSLAGDGVLGKADEVEIPGFDDFIQRADWPRIEKWIETTAESASATTGARMLKLFEDAAAFRDPDTGRGRTPVELARQILDAGITQSESRARMLAHTGAVWGYNEGAVQRYQVEGIAVVEWLTAEDELRCPFCASMNGKRVRTGDPYWQAGDTISLGDEGVLKIPSGKFGFDVRHPPLHPNCRCTLIPVVVADQVNAPPPAAPPAAPPGQTAQGATIPPILFGSESHERRQEQWENGLSNEERAAFKFWGKHHELIQALDAGEAVADTAAQIHYLNMRHALDRAPRGSGTLFRGAGMDAGSIAEWLAAGEIPIRVMQGFSRSRMVAREYAMRNAERRDQIPIILIVRARGAVDITVLTELNEREFVMQKGSKFRVLSVRRRTIPFLGERRRGIVIQAEEI